MDKVRYALQQLQNLYNSKHTRSTIDVDLMLDYTRLLYASLLEQRKLVPQSPEKKEAVPEQKNEEQKQAPVLPVEEADTLSAQEDPGKGMAIEEQKNSEEVQPPEAGVAPGNIENQQIESLEQERLGISYEPHSSASEAPAPVEQVQGVLAEEEPTSNLPVEDIALDTPEIQPEDSRKVFKSAIKGFVLPKDIRNSIGINDKYLYLNELFRNHKSNYEETLDQLGRFDNLTQAKEWLWLNIAAANKWDQEDETVQDFLSMLNRFFNSK